MPPGWGVRPGASAPHTHALSVFLQTVFQHVLDSSLFSSSNLTFSHTYSLISPLNTIHPQFNTLTRTLIISPPSSSTSPNLHFGNPPKHYPSPHRIFPPTLAPRPPPPTGGLADGAASLDAAAQSLLAREAALAAAVGALQTQGSHTAAGPWARFGGKNTFCVISRYMSQSCMTLCSPGAPRSRWSHGTHDSFLDVMCRW